MSKRKDSETNPDPLVRECIDCHRVSRHAPRSDTGKPVSRCRICRVAYLKEYRKKKWQRVKARNTWKNMIARCHDPNQGKGAPEGIPKYRDYGAKGVRVSKLWRREGGFERFVKDVGLPPTKAHTLDRRNPNHGYTPKNCVWVDSKTQRANRKNSRWVTAPDPRNPEEELTMTIGDWSRLTGISRGALSWRLRNGWDPARAVSQPARVARSQVPF